MKSSLLFLSRKRMNTTTTILSRYTTAQKLSGKGSKAGKRKEDKDE